MKIGDSISSAYGIGGLFQQSGQRNKQQPLVIDDVVRQGGASLAPSTTPPSISNTMWALQATDESQTMSGTEEPGKARRDAVIKEFRDLADMSLAERIRQQMLDSMGLTEGDVAAMSTDDRMAFEKQVAEEVRRQLTGDDSKDKSAAEDIAAA
ncbi:hypothetical protein [Rhizobium sp. AN80A]|uniref:hypothetical protein n=1 Tax=Rhizobium sp. AN80A TaxID=3040673 RepID=UPI0024B33313|nr:hypothetical protein [Rhizobium sp. AN80A]